MTGSVFVTGTDTGVGKTLIACALLRRLARDGSPVVGMKPVAAGCVDTSEGRINEDVEALRASSTVRADRAVVNPYALAEPVAPHIAAAREGITIDLHHIRRCFDRLRARADAVVVEGVGGFRVPLNDGEDGADLAELLGLPVVLVVGMRLGCLNHALLAQEAILSRGLRLAGWVANRIDPDMARCEANIEFLRQRLAGPLLGEIPFIPEPGESRVLSAMSALTGIGTHRSR
jgi:dethiobiotin synthetase